MSTQKNDNIKDCRAITKLRQGNGMTQADLAHLKGVSVRTVSGWETGDRPPKDIGKLLNEIEILLNTKPPAGVEGGEEMYRQKFEDAQTRIISLLEENSDLRRKISD